MTVLGRWSRGVAPGLIVVVIPSLALAKDLLFIAIVVAFFVLSGAYVRGCERL
jgi:hypothetical protein